VDNKFKEELGKLFPSLELTYLKNITDKIALVSQVRIGNSKNYTDYEEVSLINTNNEYGVIESQNPQKQSLPADYQAVQRHALKKGDLLLSYRAKHTIKVLRVKETPARAMVGNTSTIRVEFKDNCSELLPVLVQSYLNLDIVQSYLIALATKKHETDKTKRFLISPSTLRDLPIPHFNINKEIDYEKVFMQRLAMLHKTQKLLSLSKKLTIKSVNLLDTTLPSYENNTQELLQHTQGDRFLMDKIAMLHASMEDILLEIEAKMPNSK